MLGVHSLIFLFIVLFAVGNIVSYRQYNLILLTNSKEASMKVGIYESSELRRIRCWMNKNPGHIVLPPSTVMRVRSLKLQCKTRIKHCGGVERTQLPDNGMNINNIPVVTTTFPDGAEGLKGWITLKWIRMGMANVRSIKSKELLIYDLIKENDTDLIFVTEMWLKSESNDNDLLWKKSTCLYNNEMKMECVDRINDKKGGSIALICKDNIRSKLIEKGNLRTFKYGLWNIMNGNNNFEILGLYHPLQSDTNHHMDLQFIDKILGLYTWLSEKHLHITITGDFNIHYFE